jgi:hypothetical protein
MKKLLLITILFGAALSGAQTLQWAKSMGSTNSDEAMGVTLDPSGNVLTTGYFRGTVDFDPGAGVVNLTSAGTEDIFVSKLDASGNFVWAANMGGTGNDFGYAIATDASGNVFITGNFQGTADFDPGTGTFNLTAAGSGLDVFIVKLDAAGNFLWAAKIGGGQNDYGYSITTDASGNVYTSGNFVGSVDFDPGVGTFNMLAPGSSSWDAFISKLDAAGNFVWAKQLGGTNNEGARSIVTDGLGNVYTAGYFAGTADFDPGVGTYTLAGGSLGDIFVSKLDASGNFIFAKAMGGAAYDDCYAITLDGSGNIYTTGIFKYTSDFDPGAGTYTLTSPSNTDDIFISKLDGNGNFVWARSMGSTSTDLGYSIATDASGNVYTTGVFRSTVDFDPGAGTFSLTAAGSDDIFISKLDAAGNFITAKQIGGTGNEVGASLVTDAFGSLHLAGSFNSTVDFDPDAGVFNLISKGNFDAYVIKLNGIVLGMNEENNFSTANTVYPNPSSGAFKIQSETGAISSVEIINALGQTVYDKPNFVYDQTIEVNDLQNGIYTVRIFENGKISIVKMVLQK